MYQNDYISYPDSQGGYPKRTRGEKGRQNQGYHQGNHGQYNQYQGQPYQQSHGREQEFANHSSHNYKYDEADAGAEQYATDSQYGEQNSAKPPRKIQLFIGGIPPSVTESSFRSPRILQGILRELWTHVGVQNGHRQGYS